MKKKLALLLVLTMILSAIPMNVFGASIINRGPVVYNAGNTYAEVRVDIAQLAPLFYTVDTNQRYDGSGYYGIPIEVKLSGDDGASFLLNDSYNVPGNSAAISLTEAYNTFYAVSMLQNNWNTTNGAGKETTVLDGGTSLTAAVTTDAALTEFTQIVNPVETVAKAALAGGYANYFAKLPGFVTSAGAAYAPNTYVTTWTLGSVAADGQSARFYLQVKNMTTGDTTIPDVNILQQNALVASFTVPVSLIDRDAVENTVLTVNALHNIYGEQKLTDGKITNNAFFNRLMVKTNTLAKFANTGFLDTLQVGENIANYLNGYGYTSNTTASVKAPSDSVGIIEFRFESPYARLVNNAYTPLEFADFANSFKNNLTGTNDKANDSASKYSSSITATWGARSVSGYPTVDDYDLRLTFNSRLGTNGLSAVADTLSLKNLMVSFDERMPYGVDTKLQYRTMTNAEVLENNDGDAIAGKYSDWTNTAAAVVTRVDNNVNLGLVTGRNTNVVKEAADVAAVSGRRDVVTEVVRLQETVPNSWNTGTTTFTVPDGVEIVGAHASIYETSMAGVRGSKKEGTILSANTMTSDTNGSTEYVKILRHQNIYNGASIEVDEKALTVRPMVNYVTNTGIKREIEVQLKVSVEAGYAAKYGDTIDLAVETSADLTAQSVTIANVHDPITAILDAEVLALPTEANFNVTGYDIGDILFTETKAGDLRQSSELWVYVVGSSNLDLTLDANRAIAMLNDDTTLAFYNGVQLRHNYGNFYLNGLRFDIQRASAANGPAGKQAAGEFAIEDVTLTGVVQPGAEYTIVVSGSAVAENDYTVWANSTVGSVLNQANQTEANDDTGIFDANPYELDPFTWDADAYAPPVAEAPPADDTTGPVATISAPKTFNAYSYSYDTDANGNPRSYNNFYMAAASNGAGYTGISPRAFAEFVGGEVSDFDDAARSVTITGLNQKTGAEVVVELTLDSTTAVVDGVETDIAEYNNVLDLYPVGSIKPFQPGNNRMYMPIRFLANAYQVDFTWDDITKSVTLYPGA